MSVYGMTFRRKVVRELEQGKSVADVARHFGIDQKTVRSYRQRAAESRLCPDPSGPRHFTKLTDDDIARLQQQVRANPGVTLRELKGMLSVNVAESTVHRALKKLGLTFKKSR